jgi:hypothetical protein
MVSGVRLTTKIPSNELRVFLRGIIVPHVIFLGGRKFLFTATRGDLPGERIVLGAVAHGVFSSAGKT